MISIVVIFLCALAYPLHVDGRRGYSAHQAPWFLTRHLSGARRSGQCNARLPDPGMYRHIFLFALDGIWTGLERNATRFLQHHCCAGRKDNQSVIDFGRGAVQYFSDYFGIDMSAVADADIIDGNVPLAGGKMFFHPFYINPITKYRLIIESGPRGSFSYRNVPVSDAGWVIEVTDTVQVTGTGFSGTLDRTKTLFYGEYMAQTHLENPRGTTLLFQYRNVMPSVFADGRVYLFNNMLVHTKFGQGQSHGIINIDTTTGVMNGRETLTFPARA
ncbi:uncharacterized protein LOC106177445 [Lingula anatina]|uniref:Uncharacterized protein LOC106177445 n=1 Tax=Lingula anatina TaxID=7574 RepID=A0A1S3JZ44_LINAN|nr:uncharacterized protein LOC106177445 [Lingula anatina]|eukprot:XP_013415663.1 uncharacterized protein LOC106177445 [Lingula anatina]